MLSIDVLSIQAILVAGTSFLIATWWLKWWKTRNKYTFPPGPKPLPLVGNLWSFCSNNELHLSCEKWAKEYGDMVHLKLGGYDAIIINSPKVAKEAYLDKAEFCSNRAPFVLLKLMGSPKGILMRDYSPELKELRRTCMRSLRDFGVGKASVQDRILDEVNAMAGEIDKAPGGVVNVSSLFSRAMFNMICSIIFGNRYEYNDPELKFMINTLAVLVDDGRLDNIELFVPALLPLMPLRNPGLIKAIGLLRKLRAFMRNKIEEHKATFDETNLRDFIDLYLSITKEGGNSGIEESHIFISVMDMFAAGAETTSSVLTWAVLLLMLNPDKQHRCRQEIQQVFGSKAPSCAEKKRTPYVEAVINETLRRGNIVALGLFHSTSVDGVSIGGYTVPKDTLLYLNHYYIHMDPRYWQDPEEFTPERWLTEDDQLIRHEPFLPFGTGPRECAGRSLANDELYLFLTTLLQQFSFHVVDPDKPPSTKGELKSALRPAPYQVRVERI